MSLVVFNNEIFDQLAREAQGSDRRRTHRNLHASLEDKCQRMLVAMEADSYIPPHRHQRPSKPELLTVLRGSIAVLIFDDGGTIVQVIRCDAGGINAGCDIPAGIWHSIISLKPGTIFLEAKPGPYERLTPEDFGKWAPAESDTNAADYLQTLHAAVTPNVC